LRFVQTERANDRLRPEKKQEEHRQGWCYPRGAGGEMMKAQRGRTAKLQ